MKDRFPFLVFMTFVLCLAWPAGAATRIWSGAGPTDFWTNAANWGGTAPVAGDDLVFPAGALRLSNSNNFAAATAFHSLTISGSNYVVNCNSVTLQAGLTNNPPVGTNVCNAPIILGSNQFFVVSSNSTLNLVGNLDTGAKVFTLILNGDLAASGVISSGGGLDKSGNGTLTLSGANTYGGSTTVQAGRVTLLSSTGLGNPGSPTVVSSSGTLELGGIGTMTVPVTLAGTLRNLAGTNILSGAINFSDPSAVVLVETNTALTLSNALTGVGGLVKNGPGVLTVAGTAANTYALGTLVNQGTLLLNKAPGANAVPGSLTIGDGVGGAGADIVRLLADNQISDSAAVSLASSGLLDLNNHSDTIGALSLTNATVQSGI